MPETLYDKIWESHSVRDESSEMPGVMYIDLHLVHEVTSPQGFDTLRERNLAVRRPERIVATVDHSTPTLPADENGKLPYYTDQAEKQVELFRRNCSEFGIDLHDFGSEYRGIVHVIGPELGATQPGMTIVCGDSHTSTHGAFGALAFGIGSTEVGYVLATQSVLQRKAKNMRIMVDGQLPSGSTAKDLVLHIINHIGVNGSTGHVIEYAGSAIRALDMESRMTLCNMSIEAGARAGMIAPDETTVSYLRGRERVPSGAEFDVMAQGWLNLASDEDAVFDREVSLSAADVQPTITYGTDPSMSVPVIDTVPRSHSDTEKRALDYMAMNSGDALVDRRIDIVFIGSCTNGRISDLRAAADIVRGRKIAEHVRMLVVPGSEAVKAQAESEGLHEVFTTAGAEWRQPGCSMCIAMNGDIVPPGKTAVSTSNRNFEGRQGAGARTMLASPATAAASAVAGKVADPREYQSNGESL